MNRNLGWVVVVVGLGVGGCAANEPVETTNPNELEESIVTNDWSIAAVEGGYEVVAPAPLLAQFEDGDRVDVGVANDHSERIVSGRIQSIGEARIWVATDERLQDLDLFGGDSSFLMRLTANCTSSDATDVAAVCSELGGGGGSWCGGCWRNPGLAPWEGNQAICFCPGRVATF